MKRMIATASLLLAAATVPAFASDVAIGVKGGTQGLGLELTKGISDSLNIRFDVNGFTYDADETYDGNAYNLDLDLSMYGAHVDWHPMRGGFYVTAGIYGNGSELTGQTVGDITINGIPYPGVTLGAQVDFDSTAPYVGIGFGNAVSADKRLGFNLNVGVIYTGSPQVALSDSSNTIPPADLRAEEQKLQEEIDDFEYYPVVSVGMSYRF